MPMHRLTRITLGVPDVASAAAYYTDFGLSAGDTATDATTRHFSTVDGGEQLTLAPSARRRLIDLGIGVDDPDDLDRISDSIRRLGIDVRRDAESLTATDQGTGVNVTVEIASRLASVATAPPPPNAPGIDARQNERAPAILRDAPVRPRKLGHVVMGSTDQQASQRFFVEGLGFKISDTVPGLAAFMRCSSDHHNVLIQQAPIAYLHHTSWQVDDVDEVGRGATRMLDADPSRHVWGLGRHHIGSNFFWYLKDPAGNFSEYYSDLDCIVDDELWEPGVWEGPRGLYNWGPPPPPSFLAPEDLAELMTGAHTA